jgi:hypothetical protein
MYSLNVNMSSEFIKVSQGDSTNQVVDIKGVKGINNIKVVRPEESEYSSSESSYSGSEVSEEPIRKKKTKKVLRKKESHRPINHDYSMFSNPKKVSQQQNIDDDSESEYSEESSQMGSEYSEESEQPKSSSFEEKQKRHIKDHQSFSCD